MMVLPMLRDRRRVLKSRHLFASWTTEDDCSSEVPSVRSDAGAVAIQPSFQIRLDPRVTKFLRQYFLWPQ